MCEYLTGTDEMKEQGRKRGTRSGHHLKNKHRKVRDDSRKKVRIRRKEGGEQRTKPRINELEREGREEKKTTKRGSERERFIFT